MGASRYLKEVERYRILVVVKGCSRQLQRCFKVDSRVLKKVLSVFQENIIKSVKNLPMKFCSAILL